jgi:tRNA nucleotidyltransferase (CCA-adding enzyme)
MMEVLEKVKSAIRPDSSVLSKIDSFIGILNSKFKSAELDAICVPGGSVAKGTFLKDDFDVDLFVKFDYRFRNEDISSMLEKILKEFKPERIHGSRDYFQLKRDGLNFEIVPVLDITDPEKSLNVTDMSPMHVDWVKRRLKKGMEDDIRLAKRFCKSAGVYGAESYINGFSGHVIDILVIHHGSFLKLLEASKKWKPKVVIDAEKHFKSNLEVLFALNQSKIQGPMIVIDPLLKTRNAASALSYEKFSVFRKAAADFLKRPSEDFFVDKHVDEAGLFKRYKGCIILDIKAKTGKTDVVGSKLLKAFEFISKGLTKKGFVIKESGWQWNKEFTAIFWFALKDNMLPAKRIVNGPPIDMEKASKEFKSIYKDAKPLKGRLVATVKEDVRDAKSNIELLCLAPYFKEKASLKKIRTEKYK